MRLRKLKYPIAIETRTFLQGGWGAALHKPSRYNWNLASYYQSGGYDDAIIYDSTGRRFEIEVIELRKPAWWRYVLDRLGYLIILPNPDAEPMVDVDMVLRQTGTLTLEEFCQHMLDLLIDNPSWWSRFSTEARVRKIFEGDHTFEEAINHIGIYDPPGKERLPGRSSKVCDLR